jgi:uncharacterized protein YdbL (DUF1318 family)
MHSLRLLAVLTAIVALSVSSLAQSTEDAIKARIAGRFNQIATLKGQLKIGETFTGTLGTPSAATRNETIMVENQPMTIGAFIDAENADRNAIYVIIADRVGEGITAAEVAESSGQNRFDAASVGHWLRGKSGLWTKKTAS